MADSEILYIVKANNQQAIDAFNKLAASQQNVEKQTRKLANSTQQGNMMLMSTGRLVQDAPFGLMGMSNNITFLAEQFAYAKAQGIGFGGALKGMMTSMMGTGGVIFAISLVTSVLTMLSMKSKDSTKDMESFADVLDRASKGSKEFSKELEKLRGEIEEILKPGALDYILAGMGLTNITSGMVNTMQGGAYVSATNRERVLLEQKEKNNELTRIAVDLTKNHGAAIGEVVKQEMLRDKDLKFMQQYLEGELDKIPKVSAYYAKYADTLEAVNQQLGKTKKIVTELREVMNEGGTLIGGASLPFDAEMLGDTTIPNHRARSPYGAAGGGGAMGAFTVQYAQNLALVTQLTMSSADVLRGEFMSAWEDIFGEANSLFEKFIANIVNQLANIAVTNLAGSFLNFLFPGAGALAGMASGALGKTQQINLQLDKQTMATWYVGGKNQASRLRMD